MALQRRRELSTLALFIATIAWGSSFFVLKDAFNDVSPAYLMALRFTLGALLLAALFFRRLKTLTVGKILRGALVGALLFLATYTQALGLVGTTPGKNAFLTVVYCVLVPFLFWIITKKRPPAQVFLAAALCFAGVGVVSLTEQFTIVPGDLLTLLSGFLFAAHIVALAVFGRDMDPIALTIVQFATIAALFWSASLIFEGPPTKLGGDMIGVVVYLVLCPTICGYLFQTIGQKHVRPDVASIIFSLESVFGVLFSVAFYGEALTGRLVTGFLMIFVAVILSQIDVKHIFKRA
jgi:drug/metabolite transporter (DMT)-like permease